MTILFVPKEDLTPVQIQNRFLSSSAYPDIQIVIGAISGYSIQSPPREDNIRVVHIENTSTMWSALLEHVLTPYVLFARDLHELRGDWALLERSIRLLHSDNVGAVGGSSRNRTGHWRTSCYQVKKD